jgi:hypothetical protein
VRPSLLWLYSDDDFDPQLGFYRRPGSTRQEARLEFAPRPTALGLREVVFGPAYSLETDPSYEDRLGQEGSGRVQLNWRSGSSLGYEIAHFVDDVLVPFELYTHLVEAGRYKGFRHRFNASGPSRQVLGLDGSYEIIELFGGLAHQPTAGVTARVGKHFTIAGRYTHLVGHFDERQETFDFGFANANIDVAITRNLAFDNLIRLDLSPGVERFGLQTRLRWRFLPGSDLFVVYRNDIPLQIGPPDPDPNAVERTQFHEITVKMTYYLRALLRQ